jgi:hypothetical protein
MVDIFFEHLDQNVRVAAITAGFPLQNNFSDHCSPPFHEGAGFGYRLAA